MHQNAGLAEIVYDAFIPVAQILHAIAYRRIQAQAAGARHPGRFLGMTTGTAWSACGFLCGGFDALNSAHRLPVVLVFDGTGEADLIVLTVGCPPRPGKLVGAAAKHEYI